MTTINELVSLYERWAEAQVKIGVMARGTFFYYRLHFAAFCQLHGAKPVVELKPIDLMLWGTYWHRVQAIKRLFKWGLEAGIVPVNPVAHVPKPPPGQRNRVLSPIEQCRALRGANREFRGFLQALRGSIARPLEIRDLVWPQLVRTASGILYICQAEFKGRRRRKNPHAKRVIPVSARLGRLLVRLRRRRPESRGHVFLNTAGQAWTGNAVRIAMAELRGRVGLAAGDDDEHVVCYTWRHTAATAATARGLRDRVLAELMGHTSTRTTARYQHLSADQVLVAYNTAFKNPRQSTITLAESAAPL